MDILIQEFKLIKVKNEIVHDWHRLCWLVSGTCFADIGNQVYMC